MYIESHLFPGLVWEVVALYKLARPDKVETCPDTALALRVTCASLSPGQRVAGSLLGHRSRHFLQPRINDLRVSSPLAESTLLR
ncbi:hypothetical protein TNCV_4114441 [Trichonephila clavipes]|nr:hypothetical protein TNCV_4114441 [Trichonephila clavipes]